MSSDWDHEALREYVIGHARSSGVATDQGSLAAVTGIDSGLLGRYFRGETQPGSGNLQKIAARVPGTSLDRLLVLAGRAPADAFGDRPAAPMPPALHPYAVEVDRLLGTQSVLADDERTLLATLLDRILSPYRAPRRRAA